MKNILDKIDQSPLWLRLSLVFMLIIVLGTGLFLVKKQREQLLATSPSSSQSTEPTKVKESTEQKSDREQVQLVKEAEEAVKKLESEQVADNIAPAQEKVAKVKDQATRVKFQQRMKAVADALTAQTGIYYEVTVENPTAATAQQQDGTTQAYQTPVSSVNAETGEATISSNAGAGIE